jgi:hypothetical protein
MLRTSAALRCVSVAEVDTVAFDKEPEKKTPAENCGRSKKERAHGSRGRRGFSYRIKMEFFLAKHLNGVARSSCCECGLSRSPAHLKTGYLMGIHSPPVN